MSRKSRRKNRRKIRRWCVDCAKRIKRYRFRTGLHQHRCNDCARVTRAARLLLSYGEPEQSVAYRLKAYAQLQCNAPISKGIISLETSDGGMTWVDTSHLMKAVK